MVSEQQLYTRAVTWHKIFESFSTEHIFVKLFCQEILNSDLQKH